MISHRDMHVIIELDQREAQLLRYVLFMLSQDEVPKAPSKELLKVIEDLLLVLPSN